MTLPSQPPVADATEVALRECVVRLRDVKWVCEEFKRCYDEFALITSASESESVEVDGSLTFRNEKGYVPGGE